jgi:pyruvate kinase
MLLVADLCKNSCIYLTDYMNILECNSKVEECVYCFVCVLNLMIFLFVQGPEIRTGFLKDGKPVKLTQGKEITITTDYSIKGDENMISMSYQRIAVDLKPGSTILCADGTITLTVLSCDPAQGLVRCRCENSALLGERKNVNLPGVIVDLPTLTEKDKEDILKWGVPNKIDMIALSFVRKGSDLQLVRSVLGEHAKSILLMSKVCSSLQ